jgi:hypothetical protein
VSQYQPKKPKPHPDRVHCSDVLEYAIRCANFCFQDGPNSRETEDAVRAVELLYRLDGTRWTESAETTIGLCYVMAEMAYDEAMRWSKVKAAVLAK